MVTDEFYICMPSFVLLYLLLSVQDTHIYIYIFASILYILIQERNIFMQYFNAMSSFFLKIYKTDVL